MGDISVQKQCINRVIYCCRLFMDNILFTLFYTSKRDVRTLENTVLKVTFQRLVALKAIFVINAAN